IEGALGTELPPPPPPPPPPQVTKIELDTGPIGFRGGVPVGGTSHVTLFSDGTVNYTGHFHDSGAPSYDMAMVWVLSVGSGTTFTLAHTCRVHGTFEPGSRDCDWMVTTPNNQAVANVFGEFAAGNF